MKQVKQIEQWIIEGINLHKSSDGSWSILSYIPDDCVETVDLVSFIRQIPQLNDLEDFFKSTARTSVGNLIDSMECSEFIKDLEFENEN